MKNFYTLLFVLTALTAFSQNLPINFEGDITTADFVDFDGGTATVTSNPMPSGINTSSSVAQIVRDGGAIFAGSKIILTDNLDFSVLTKISMKVYTTAPIGTTVKFKLEGSAPSAEIDAFTTVSGTWETLEWIFLGIPNNLNEIVFMFDFGNLGDGTANSTFYFDDIEQVVGPTPPVPTSLPIDFETAIVDTDFLNFNGSLASVIPNPQVDSNNPSNTVAQIIKDGGEFWGGSKIFLDNPIDLSSEWQISMKVYTDAPVGTLLKFKIESNVAGFADERDAVTTTSGEWATYAWDFTNFDSPIYNVLTLMLGYATPNDASANATFLFDDIQRTNTLSVGNDETFNMADVSIYPNPTKDIVTIRSKNKNLKTVALFDILGNQILFLQINGSETTLDISNLASGIYITKIQTETAHGSLRLIKE